MRKIKARDILHMPVMQLYDTAQFPLGTWLMEFDDGDMEVTWRGTVLSVFLWAVQRKYPQAPLLKRHHLGKRRLVKKTTSNILGDVINDAYDTYSPLFDDLATKTRATRGDDFHAFYLINDFKRKLFMEDLSHISINGSNDLYNFIGEELLAWPSTLSMFDVFEINDDPVIKSINAELIPDDEVIDRTHAKLISRITTPGVFLNNNIAEGAKSNLVSVKQMSQLHSSLGYRTDCDSTIFPNPILVSGYEGYNTLHDFAIESRSATKSLVNNKAWLSNTQYTNRRIEIIMAGLKGVVMDDCGNRSTIPLFVKDMKTLARFEGKRYIDEEGNWKLLDLRQPDAKKIIGTTINFRTALRCQHHLENFVCSGCMGEIARTVPLYTNIGHLSATTIGAILAQATLSTKHYDGNASFMDIYINKSDGAYITGNTKEAAIRLNEKGKAVAMILNIREIPGIKALQHTDSIRTLIANNISSLTNVTMVSNYRGEEQLVPVSLHQDVREVCLSHDMMEYIAINLKNARATISREGDLRIPLDLWEFNKVAFAVSRKNENITDLVNKINTMILGTSTGSDEERDSVKVVQTASLYAYETPEEALMALYQLMSALEEVNIVHLENMIIAFSGISDSPVDYRIGRGHPDMKLIRYSALQYKRSFSQLLSLNQARKELLSPDAYMGAKLPSHPFDELIMPTR